MISGFVFSFLVTRALDRITSRVEGKAESLFRGELNKIEDRLERIERSVQNLNLAPLKSAYASIKLGDFDHAYSYLLTSLGIDQGSPTTKFWLSMVLAQQGKAAEAQQLLGEALLRNPFVLPVYWADDVVSDWMDQRGEPVSVDMAWYGDLHKLAEKKGHGLIRRFVSDLQRQPTGPFKPGRIHQVSFGGSHPVVHWAENATTKLSPPNQLTALDLDSGHALWNHRTIGELCFSTPQVIVVRHQGRQQEFRLLDLFTGETVADLRLLYDEVLSRLRTAR